MSTPSGPLWVTYTIIPFWYLAGACFFEIVFQTLWNSLTLFYLYIYGVRDGLFTQKNNYLYEYVGRFLLFYWLFILKLVILFIEFYLFNWLSVLRVIRLPPIPNSNFLICPSKVWLPCPWSPTSYFHSIRIVFSSIWSVGPYHLIYCN